MLGMNKRTTMNFENGIFLYKKNEQIIEIGREINITMNKYENDVGIILCIFISLKSLKNDVKFLIPK